jgi:hypothetical protein
MIKASKFKDKPSTTRMPAQHESKIVDLPSSSMRRVTFLEKERNMCGWPLGDVKSSKFRYCGNPIENPLKSSYCAFHAKLVKSHTPPKTK